MPVYQMARAATRCHPNLSKVSDLRKVLAGQGLTATARPGILIGVEGVAAVERCGVIPSPVCMGMEKLICLGDVCK
jgi:hypothetical protein